MFGLQELVRCCAACMRNKHVVYHTSLIFHLLVVLVVNQDCWWHTTMPSQYIMYEQSSRYVRSCQLSQSIVLPMVIRLIPQEGVDDRSLPGNFLKCTAWSIGSQKKSSDKPVKIVLLDKGELRK